jgi:hypothetical protein
LAEPYLPVSKATRLGLQIERVTKAFSKYMLAAQRLSRVGVMTVPDE